MTLPVRGESKPVGSPLFLVPQGYLSHRPFHLRGMIFVHFVVSYGLIQSSISTRRLEAEVQLPRITVVGPARSDLAFARAFDRVEIFRGDVAGHVLAVEA